MSVPGVTMRVTRRAKPALGPRTRERMNSSHIATKRLLSWTSTLRYLFRCISGKPHMGTRSPPHRFDVSLMFSRRATSAA